MSAFLTCEGEKWVIKLISNHTFFERFSGISDHAGILQSKYSLPDTMLPKLLKRAKIGMIIS